MRLLYYVLLYFVSASEFVICYYLLFHTILDKDSLSVSNKVAVLMNIILPSILLTVNRGLTFFSDVVFLFVVVIFSLNVYSIRRRDFWFIVCCICLYYTVVALVDMCVAFLSMTIFEKNFLELIYFGAVSLWQIVIYTVSRIGLLILSICFVRSGCKLYEEYTFIFLSIDVILFLVLKRYQQLIVDMALREINMDGINSGFSLLSAVMATVLIMVLVMKNQIMQKENKFLEMHDQMTEESYHMLRQNVEANHQLVHDMKHHLLFLRKLVEENNIKQIGLYLDDIEEEYIEVADITWTGNRFLDFILNQKKQKAQGEGIQFIIESEVIPQWNLTENEMSVMFGNLLDNAIEACEKIKNSKKWIRVSLRKRACILLIQIGNSIGNRPAIRQDRMISDKPNPQLHGYGLKSVRRIVEEQEGCMNLHILEDKFYIDITFFNSDRRREGKV